MALGFLGLNHQSFLGGTPGSAFLAFGAAVLLTLPAYALGKLGAGDVKMLSAMGLIGGLTFMLMSYVIAATLSIAIIFFWHVLLRIMPYFNLKLSGFGWQIPIAVMPAGKFLPFGTLLGVGGASRCFGCLKQVVVGEPVFIPSPVTTRSCGY